MFKVGDWVINDYEIKQVQKVENGAVTQVSCGNFQKFGSYLECRPLTLRNKNIASTMKYYYDLISKLPGSRGLNFPDINRYLCVKCFEAIDSGDNAGIERVYSDVKDFFRNIEDRLTDNDTVDGVRIFR